MSRLLRRPGPDPGQPTGAAETIPAADTAAAGVLVGPARALNAHEVQLALAGQKDPAEDRPMRSGPLETIDCW